MFLILMSGLGSATSMCPYVDAHWKVNYMRGLLKFHEDNDPEPPVVNQIGSGRVHVRWGHLVKESQCVDRFILHLWDTKSRLMRYIFNSNKTKGATVNVPMCTKLSIKVEIQEDDLPGYPPDSEFTSVAEEALTSKWLGDPIVNTNRSQVAIDRSFSHWSQVYQASYLKGAFLDWENMVLNMECVKRIEVIVSRLVKGRLSDSVKTIRVPVPRDQENITLVLPCDDMLPYEIQVELVEAVSIDGVKKFYAERSNLLEVPLICPWSETNCGRNYQFDIQQILSLIIFIFVNILC